MTGVSGPRSASPDPRSPGLHTHFMSGEPENAASTVAQAAKRQRIKYVAPPSALPPHAPQNPNFVPRKAHPDRYTVTYPSQFTPGQHRWKRLADGQQQQPQPPANGGRGSSVRQISRHSWKRSEQPAANGAASRAANGALAGNGHGGQNGNGSGAINMHYAAALQLPQSDSDFAGKGAEGADTEPGEVVPVAPDGRLGSHSRSLRGAAAAGGSSGSGSVKLSDLYAAAHGLSPDGSPANNGGGGYATAGLRSGGSGGRHVHVHGADALPFSREGGYTPRSGAAAAAAGKGRTSSFRRGFAAAEATLEAADGGAWSQAMSQAAAVADMPAGDARAAAQQGFRARVAHEAGRAAVDPALEAELATYIAAAMGGEDFDGGRGIGSCGFDSSGRSIGGGGGRYGGADFEANRVRACRSVVAGSGRTVHAVPDAMAASAPGWRKNTNMFRKGARAVEVVAGGNEAAAAAGSRYVTAGAAAAWDGKTAGGGGGRGQTRQVEAASGRPKSGKQPAAAAQQAPKAVKPRAAQVAAAPPPKPVSLDQKLGMSLDALSGKATGVAKPAPARYAARQPCLPAAKPAANAGGGGGAVPQHSGKHKPIQWGA